MDNGDNERQGQEPGDLARPRPGSVRRVLRKKEAWADEILRTIPDRILRVSADGIVLEEFSGDGTGSRQTANSVGEHVSVVVPDEDEFWNDNIKNALKTMTVVTVDTYKDSSDEALPRALETRIVPLSYNQVTVVIRDVTERRAIEDEMARHAVEDSLTGLANRVLLDERLDHAIIGARRRGGVIAALLLDLDEFKFVNDTYGHEAGDQLLIEIAKRLRESVRAPDTVARLGGDEFVVLLEELDELDEVLKLADRISGRLQEPLSIGGRILHVTASIGIAVSVDGSSDAETMINNADAAMYSAKAQGSNRVELYDQSLKRRLEERKEMENALREAIVTDGFEMFYQPIRSIETGEISGVEALIRWKPLDSNSIGPSEFIPIAEESGLIVPIGGWVLRKVCGQAVTWRNRFDRELSVAVNVSVRQLLDPSFGDIVCSVLDAVDLPPHQLTLDVPEAALIGRPETVIANLSKVRHRGVNVAVDDFGTGFASMVYLRNMPVTHVKIDRSCIGGITKDHDDALIVESTIALAHGLGRKVIAVGVQNDAQLRALKAYGCDLAQGYFLGRPQPVEGLDRLLSRDEASPLSGIDPSAFDVGELFDPNTFF